MEMTSVIACAVCSVVHHEHDAVSTNSSVTRGMLEWPEKHPEIIHQNSFPTKTNNKSTSTVPATTSVVMATTLSVGTPSTSW